MVSASFGHFKSPLGWRFDLIIRARRLECGVYDALTVNLLGGLLAYCLRDRKPSLDLTAQEFELLESNFLVKLVKTM
ncbi:hypothetical protein FWP30_18595 [Vibrio parahaemolyticus]|nr:hypothetical protein [Vibrio parahaemolyticus]